MGSYSNASVPGGPPNVTPRVTPRVTPVETPCVTPFGRSMTQAELAESGKKEVAATIDQGDG